MNLLTYDSYECPYCSKSFSLHRGTLESFNYFGFGSDEPFAFNQMDEAVDFSVYNSPNPKLSDIPLNGLSLNILRCPRKECRGISIILNSYGRDYPFYCGRVAPNKGLTEIPSYVPPTIAQDIREAELILDLSPKASATLSRRALQGMIRDFYSIKNEKTLYHEIDAIKDKIDQHEYNALTSLRSIGNISAHPEKNEDINIMLDVDPGEAAQLVLLIHHFIESWYTKRHKTSELLENVSKLKLTKDAIKKGVGQE